MKGTIDMISNWIYNYIKDFVEKERYPVTLDSVLDKIPTGRKFPLLKNHPVAVSTSTGNKVYIKPILTDTQTSKDSKLFLFSAPGATGKSALASFVVHEKNAVLWDLSKERIGNHSLSGMLIKSLGSKLFSEFTEGLLSGNSVLVIDALDEAEMISGQIALEALLSDLQELIEESHFPSVILCARTETARSIRRFYSTEEHRLPISQYEIGFFSDSSAKDFIREKIREKCTITPAIEKCINAQFTQIQRILSNDEVALRSFIGYAPVLEALAIFFEEENNTIHLLQQTESATDSTELFIKILDYILLREQKKVSDAFRTRCENNFPEFQDWKIVYQTDEQVVRLANYMVFGSSEYEIYPLALPRELSVEYAQCIDAFLKDHPFIHSFEEDSGVRIDFTGPAFRDYVLAKLMVKKNYDDYAKHYFTEHSGTTRFPSQLFFDIYAHYSPGIMQRSHFSYLYDAFKSKETSAMVSSVVIEQTDDTVYCSFIHETRMRNMANALTVTEFSVSENDDSFCVSQLSNAYIDINEDLTLGVRFKDVTIRNSTIKCRKLIVQSPNITLSAYSNEKTLIACTDGIDISACPRARFEVRIDNDDNLMISIPDIDEWFKLYRYRYELEDESKLDAVRFENSVMTILKYFRKHGKDVPSRHREFIQNIVVGGSTFKQQILEFLLIRNIIYEDSKDLSQFKLNMEKAEEYEINWGNLSLHSTPYMQKAYDEYCLWKEE